MVYAITRSRPLNLTLYQARLLQLFQVLADSRLRQGQDLNYFAADTAVDLFQVLNDFKANRVSQGFENPGKFFSVRAAGDGIKQKRPPFRLYNRISTISDKGSVVKGWPGFYSHSAALGETPFRGNPKPGPLGQDLYFPQKKLLLWPGKRWLAMALPVTIFWAFEMDSGERSRV
jgi:hypothetical protein